MLDKIGNKFEGIISGVTKYGIYVELPNTVEGFVHVMYMYDDHYDFVEDAYALIGENTGKMYKLGQKVNIKVTGVDVRNRTIDFQIAYSEEEMKEYLF